MSGKTSTQPSPRQDIAIIGMACLFPGAEDLPAYWRNILNNVDAVGEPPPGWGAERYYDPEDTSGDRIYTHRGGFLGDLARFNPAEFGIMPNSLDGGEPDQFLALRVAHRALLDAGCAGSEVDHTATGIILGHSTYLHRGNAGVVQHGVVLDQTVELLAQLHPGLGQDALAAIRRRLKDKLPPFDVNVAPGLVPNVMTGRIANRLDFKGPNYLIDAACASSLLAVSAAMEELRQGRADLMLAGGVNASIPAEVDMVFCQLGALSKGSRIRPFDRDADGTLLGEGLGVLVLKRLADAQRDGDRIYAVLKAIGQSSDGRGLGLLAPRQEGEALSIQRAYQQADIDPSSVTLVEAHGTGIPLGDKTEISALNTVLGERRGPLATCALGSVKSQISHCIPAAGSAALIKTALALYHKVLPPTLCHEVNPDLGIEQTPFYINTETRPWIHSENQPRRAGVDAFGFGGINTHALLEEPPGSPPPSAGLPRKTELLVLAARSREQLLGEMRHLATRVEQDDQLTLYDLAGTLQARVAEGHQRLGIVARDPADLVKKLRQAAKHLDDPERHRLQSRSGVYFCDRPLEGKLAFLFPGEGSQYTGMLSDLACHFPQVREWFDFWDDLYPDQREIPPSQVVFPPPTGLSEETRKGLQERLFAMDMGSEAVFIASQALFDLLETLDVRADMMVGHSTGENTALVASRAVRVRDRSALGRHIRNLNQVYQAMEHSGDIPTGMLLTVGAIDRARVLEEVESSGGRLHLAMDNCFHQAVLFGDRESIETAARNFTGEGGLCSYLAFDRAYHTPLFAPVTQAFTEFYTRVKLRSPEVPLYSCASTEPFPRGDRAVRELAASQWSTRVRFIDTVERLYSDGARVFLEVGPGGNLSAFVKDILKKRPYLALQCNDRNRSGLEQIQHLLATLFVEGRAPRLERLFAGRPVNDLDLAHARSPRHPAPTLVNTLPYIRLNREESAELQALLMSPTPSASPAAASVDAPQTEPTAAPQAAPRTAAASTSAPKSAGRPAPPIPAGARNHRGMSQHIHLMNRFLASQEQVMRGYLKRRSDVTQGGPFIQRVLQRDRDGVVAECTLTLAGMRFLQDHVLSGPVSARDPGLRGLSVVPLTVSLEMLAEVAALTSRLPTLASLRNIQAHRWIALDQENITLRLSGRRLTTTPSEERVHAQVHCGRELMIESEVVFQADPSSDEQRLSALSEPRPSRWRDRELYTTGMFHGPLFQSIRHLRGWNGQGIDADLAEVSTEGFFTNRETPTFLFNPVLLDAVGQLSAYWVSEQVGTDFNCFPSRIERVDFNTPNPDITDGLTLQGRLAFLPPESGTSRFLEGRFECLDARGRLLFHARGWRDRYFSVPHRFYQTRANPATGRLGEDWSGLFNTRDTVVWHVPPFPPGFLDDAGAIWKRVLVHQTLSREERRTWYALPPNPRRRSEWLLARIAVKEAVRHWFEERHGIHLYATDIRILKTQSGKPYLEIPGVRLPSSLPEISLSHSQGMSVAAVGRTAVGVDLEPLGRIDVETLVKGAFSSPERDWLNRADPGQQEVSALGLWCAKEAAAKALGIGLTGRPQAFVVSAPEDEPASVSFGEHEIPVRVRESSGNVIALANPQ